MNHSHNVHLSGLTETWTTGSPVRVVLVDDHEDFLSSLGQFISASKRVTVVGIAQTGEEALTLLDVHNADLVLMDVFMKQMTGFEATRCLKAKHAALKVIIISFYDSPEIQGLAAQALADGFVSKSSIGTHLLAMIDKLFPEHPAPASPIL